MTIEECIAKNLEDAPPLTSDQIEILQGLFAEVWKVRNER